MTDTIQYYDPKAQVYDEQVRAQAAEATKVDKADPHILADLNMHTNQIGFVAPAIAGHQATNLAQVRDEIAEYVDAVAIDVGGPLLVAGTLADGLTLTVPVAAPSDLDPGTTVNTAVITPLRLDQAYNRRVEPYWRGLLASEAIGGAADLRQQIGALGAADLASLVSGARDFPGFAPDLYSQTRNGRAAGRAPLAIGTVVADPIFGQALEIAGESIPASPGYIDVALRRDVPIGPGGAVDLHYELRRTGAPIDPAGEGVELRYEMLDAAGGSLGNRRVGDVLDPAVGDAPIDVTWVVARTAGVGVDEAVSPATRAVTPFVRLYGDTGRTALFRIGACDHVPTADEATPEALADIVEAGGALAALVETAQEQVTEAVAAVAGLVLVAPDAVPDGVADRSAALNVVTAGTKRDVSLAPGDYYLDAPVTSGGACWTINGRSEVLIEGNNARLLQRFPILQSDTRMRQHLRIIDCGKVTLKNLRFGYAPENRPSAQGQVTAIASDRSTYTAQYDTEPPLFPDFDRYQVRSERTGVTIDAIYAAKDDDYDPNVNYGVTPAGGQAAGAPGPYLHTFPLKQAALATVTALLPLTFTTATPHGLPTRTKATITGAGGLVRGGTSIVNGIRLTVRVLTPTSFELYYGEDDPVDATNATAYTPGSGTITGERVSAEMQVGDTVTIWRRKHGEPPILIFNVDEAVIGTPGNPVIFDEAGAVAVKGRDARKLRFNIRVMRGSAGGIVFNGVRELVQGDFYSEQLGDDALNIYETMYGHLLLATPAAGQTYFDAQFAAGSGSVSAGILPRVRDLIEFADPTTNVVVAVRMVTGLTYLGTPGQYRVQLDGPVPAGTGPTWLILNRSANPDWLLGNVTLIGGGRCVLPKSSNVRIREMLVHGANNSTILARNPSSPVHPKTGGQQGGLVIGSLTATMSMWEPSRFSACAVILRRYGVPNIPVTTPDPADVESFIGLADLRTFGYGGLGVDGRNLTVDLARIRKGGQLRDSTPQMVATPSSSGNYDLYARQGRMTVRDIDSDAPTSLYEDDGGFVFFPNGSLLVNRVTGVTGPTIAAAKKVEVGHERRIQVRIGGAIQDPESYTANGTTALTLATPQTTPATVVVEHTRC